MICKTHGLMCFTLEQCGLMVCPHCNGYGSSLKDPQGVNRCTYLNCNGDGLIPGSSGGKEEWAYRTFARTYPHEAYHNDPERFWQFFQSERPGISREEMERFLSEYV